MQICRKIKQKENKYKNVGKYAFETIPVKVQLVVDLRDEGVIRMKD